MLPEHLDSTSQDVESMFTFYKVLLSSFNTVLLKCSLLVLRQVPLWKQKSARGDQPVIWVSDVTV